MNPAHRLRPHYTLAPAEPGVTGELSLELIDLRLTPGSWFIPEGSATEATIEFSLEDRVRGSSRE